MQGRMQTGDGTKAVQVRLREGLFSALEEWRREQKSIPSRSEAIRTLVQRSLADPDLAVSRGVEP
jgi:metal-responsive CopG/Arc/MetJ family transcriptional regulator